MISTAIYLGLAVSLVTSALIVASLAHHPRIWIGDAPPEMQQAATPLTRGEKILRLKWGVPILASMVMIVPIATLLIHRNTRLSYGEAFGTMWIAWMIFNLTDLIIIDWLIVVWWRPKWSVIEEVEDLYHLNSCGFHFRAFLIGTTLITIVSALLACFAFVL